MEELFRRCWQCFTNSLPDFSGDFRDASDAQLLHPFELLFRCVCCHGLMKVTFVAADALSMSLVLQKLDHLATFIAVTHRRTSTIPYEVVHESHTIATYSVPGILPSGLEIVQHSHKK